MDDPAIAALSKYYSGVLPPSNIPGVALVDMCSSWVRYVLTCFTNFLEAFPTAVSEQKQAQYGHQLDVLVLEELNRLRYISKSWTVRSYVCCVLESWLQPESQVIARVN